MKPFSWTQVNSPVGSGGSGRFFWLIPQLAKDKTWGSCVNTKRNFRLMLRKPQSMTSWCYEHKPILMANSNSWEDFLWNACHFFCAFSIEFPSSCIYVLQTNSLSAMCVANNSSWFVTCFSLFLWCLDEQKFRIWLKKHIWPINIWRNVRPH